MGGVASCIAMHRLNLNSSPSKDVLHANLPVVRRGASRRRASRETTPVAPPPQAGAAPDQLVQQFFDAVAEGDAEQVETMIAAGVDVGSIDEDGNTALLFAAEGEPQIVEVLLNAGVNVNAQNEGGLTALMRAVQYEDEEIIRQLLAHNANMEIENAALGDFGLAHHEPRKEWRNAKAGTDTSRRCPNGYSHAALGSPLYMAPEHRKGHLCRPFGSNDMWSLGFTLLEMMIAPAVCRYMPECVFQPSHEVYSDMKWGAHVKDELPSRVRDTLKSAGGELLAWSAQDPSRKADIDAFVELIQGLLATVSTDRLTAKQALQSAFVRGGAGAGASVSSSAHLRANAAGA